MITKRDYLLAGLNGAVTAVFAAAILYFLNLNFWRFLPAIPLLWIFGVWLGGFLGEKIAPFFTQFGKFAAVGFSSAAIDFAILNGMSYWTGVTAGAMVGWINIPGFLVAVLNGYLWNELWVFSMPALADAEPALFKDFPKFFGVTVIGLLINTSIMVFLTTYLPAPMLDKLWLNITKVLANSVAMLWNFAGYKFLAFK